MSVGPKVSRISKSLLVPSLTTPLKSNVKMIKGSKSAIYTKEDADLMFAVIHGDLQLVNESIKAGGNMEVRNIYGETPVMVAAKCNNMDCMFVLIKMGANLDIISRKGETITTLLNMNHIRSRSTQTLQ